MYFKKNTEYHPANFQRLINKKSLSTVTAPKLHLVDTLTSIYCYYYRFITVRISSYESLKTSLHSSVNLWWLLSPPYFIKSRSYLALSARINLSIQFCHIIVFWLINRQTAYICQGKTNVSGPIYGYLAQNGLILAQYGQCRVCLDVYYLSNDNSTNGQ